MDALQLRWCRFICLAESSVFGRGNFSLGSFNVKKTFHHFGNFAGSTVVVVIEIGESALLLNYHTRKGGGGGVVKFHIHARK